MEDSQTKAWDASQNKEEKPKEVFSLRITVFEDGRKALDVIAPEVDGKKFSPPMGLIREVLDWAVHSVGDMIIGAMVKAQLNALKEEKIIKPGWRPTKLLNKLAGK